MGDEKVLKRWVYGKKGSSKIVTAKEAEKLYGKDWYDSPAKVIEAEEKEAAVKAEAKRVAAEEKAKQ